MDDRTRRDLVGRAQRGDREAYELLARDASRSMFLVASRILRDRDAAEDAVQRALVAIWRDIGSLRDPARFQSWAYRIVVRSCRAERRLVPRASVDVLDVSSSLASGHDDFTAVAARDQLARAFDALSLDHRTVVVLHHLAGLSLSEIADILDIPYGTVGSRLHHAMRALRAALDAGERVVAPGGQPA